MFHAYKNHKMTFIAGELVCSTIHLDFISVLFSKLNVTYLEWNSTIIFGISKIWYSFLFVDSRFFILGNFVQFRICYFQQEFDIGLIFVLHFLGIKIASKLFQQNRWILFFDVFGNGINLIFYWKSFSIITQEKIDRYLK